MEDFPEDYGDLEDFEPEGTIQCDMCGGTCHSMGYLGSVQYFTCRQCGMQYFGQKEKK